MSNLAMFFWFLILVSFSQPAGNPRLVMAEHLSRQGLYLYALNQVDSIIDKGLEDEDTYAFRGGILSQLGMYESAITDFETARGSSRLEFRDGEWYSYARFSLGDCSAAEELRSLRYFGSFHLAGWIRLMFTEIEMHRYCNHPQKAHDVQVEMMNIFPRAVKSHLAQADLALDEGDVDLAWRALFSSQIDFQYIGAIDVLARIALIEERYEDAFRQMQYIKAQRVSDRSMILKGLATLLAGDPSVLLFRLNQSRWIMNENPHIVFLRLWALKETGENAEYSDTLSWLESYCDSDCISWVQRNLEREIQAPLPFKIL
jgi:tetratricopeptide (TPR) repeat protein